MVKISTAAWNRYKDIINEAHDDFNQDTITWARHQQTRVELFRDGIENNYQEVELKVLVGYNYFRTWPITSHDGDGELDSQNMVLYINVKYLKDNGWADINNYLDFNPANDFFIHRGIKYKGEGDTFIAQAKDEPLMFLLVLRREEETTGNSRYD